MNQEEFSLVNAYSGSFDQKKSQLMSGEHIRGENTVKKHQGHLHLIHVAMRCTAFVANKDATVSSAAFFG